MKSPFRPLILVLLVAPGAAYAAADMSTPADPVLQQAYAAAENKDWPAAQALMKQALSRDPGNADYHSYYAYTVRKGANPDMSLVFKHYNEALRIDSKHRGAHEYIGEAYLMVGNLPKAREHLAVLDKLCFLPCTEYSELKKAVAAYESNQAKR